MAGYRARLEQDLDRWIADGLVPAASREAILARAGEARRLDAATTLAVVGGVLLGIAVVAFVGANWDGIPRLARFGLVLGAFLGLVGAAAWAARGERPILRNTLLAVAALVYAAAIGLTGQIFDIAGDPRTALRAAGLGAALLALAGRSSGAAMAALVLVGLSDLEQGVFSSQREPPWLLIAAPLGVALAWRWRSVPLAHVAGLAMLVGALQLLIRLGAPEDDRLLFTAVAFGLLAAGARWRRERDGAPASVLYGWFVLGGLFFFVFAGVDGGWEGLTHRLVWLALAVGLTALGRHDRHGAVTALGVLSIIAAVCTILFDLGLGLMTAAGIFTLAAVAALTAGALLKRRAGA